MPRVLIIGYGRMGRIHARHLSEMGVPWDFHDPFVAGGVSLDRLGRYTHAVVATPIPTHYAVYRALAGFRGPILIEKPVVVRDEHLGVLDDARVFPGMCERFNPAVGAVRACLERADVVAIEFRRTSLAGSPADVGIHDLDLFCHLLDLRSAPESWWEGDEFLAAASGIVGRFRWPRSSRKERFVRITTRSGQVEFDLAAEAAAQDSAAWPVHRELTAFLRGDPIDARVSHELLLSCLRAGRAAGRNDCDPHTPDPPYPSDRNEDSEQQCPSTAAS